MQRKSKNVQRKKNQLRGLGMATLPPGTSANLSLKADCALNVKDLVTDQQAPGLIVTRLRVGGVGFGEPTRVPLGELRAAIAQVLPRRIDAGAAVLLTVENPTEKPNLVSAIVVVDELDESKVVDEQT